jgi:type I restriction-modification system DNA methylase subunit
MNEMLSTFENEFLNITRRLGIVPVFSDFLQMSICALSLGQKEELYLETIKKYSTNEMENVSRAFAALTIEMNDHGNGLNDVLGVFFTNHITRGENGQFFTPQCISELMARMVGCSDHSERICDPACGSGTMLLAKEKVCRMEQKAFKNEYFGADVDRRCAMMAAINFCLNGMCGEVAWMNSLSNEYFGGWRIDIHPLHGVPYIHEITEHESIIVLRLPEKKQALSVEFPTIKIQKVEAVQQSLFVF